MTLCAFFQKEGIHEYRLLDLRNLNVNKPALFERFFQQKKPVCAAIFLIPYDQCATGVRTVSRYAVARDYHLYVKELSERAECLKHFLCGACDHSPIDERDAALRAGLGVRGDNGLVISPVYGSFCFVGELFFSAVPEGEVLTQPREIAECPHCGKCRAACPTRALSHEGPCLSELTQKKTLGEQEAVLVREHPLLWGCDTCQEVCPLNRERKATPIEFFRQERLETLDEARLDALLENGEFARRAYHWRGEAVLRRNLRIKADKARENAAVPFTNTPDFSTIKES